MFDLFFYAKKIFIYMGEDYINMSVYSKQNLHECFNLISKIKIKKKPELVNPH